MICKITFALAALVLAAIPTLAQSPTGSWQVDAYPVDAAGHPAATTVKVPFSGVPIAPAQIPAPTASTLGGVKSSAAPANNFQTGIDTTGAPTYAQPTAGNISGLTAGASAAAGQLPGTATNDNATAGNVGEYVSVTVPIGSAVPLTSVTAANLTTQTLSAGDWDVWCDVVFNPAASTTIQALIATVTTTSASVGSGSTGGIGGLGSYQQIGFNNVAPALPTSLKAGPMRLSLNSNTSVYCTGYTQFGTSTMTMYGAFQARRRR